MSDAPTNRGGTVKGIPRWLPMFILFTFLGISTLRVEQKNLSVYVLQVQNYDSNINQPAFYNDAAKMLYSYVSGAEEDKSALQSANRTRQASQSSNVQNNTFAMNGQSPYTYVMQSWTVDVDTKNYKPYLANMLIAAKLLKEMGSKADFTCVFKMLYAKNYTKLPDKDEEMLKRMGIKIVYMPKTKDTGNFYAKTLQKSYAWKLTDYRRVLYLDADVLPLVNLDYFFELSDGPNPILKENVVVAGAIETANAGFFMIKPNITAYEHIQQIIKKKGKRAGMLPRNRIDEWGHKIVPPDDWESNVKHQGGNTEWKYHGSFCDQGLIYSYPKYDLMSLSQIMSRRINHFGPGPNGTVIKEKVVNYNSPQETPFWNLTKRKLPTPHNCGKFMASGRGWPGGCRPPYSDYVHFTEAKPWHMPPPSDMFRNDTKATSVKKLWWKQLAMLQSEGYDITFPYVKPDEKKKKK